MIAETTRESYLEALRAALAGDRGEKIRAALRPHAEGPSTWPEVARFFADGDAGFVLIGEELCGVFGAGRGGEIMRAAVAAGARFLDHFDCAPLNALYDRHGFAEVGREPNWSPGGPDVIHRRRYDRILVDGTIHGVMIRSRGRKVYFRHVSDGEIYGVDRDRVTPR